MRNLICFLSFSLLSMGAVKNVQHTGDTAVGFKPADEATISSIVLTNAAGSSVLGAFSFIAPSSPFSGTMRFKDIRVYVSAVSASPALTPSLYSDANGAVGTLIETGTASGTLSAATWNTLGGFTVTSNLTAGAQYWVVLTCTAGTSATVAYSYSSNYSFPPIAATSVAPGAWGNTLASSTNNGSTWAGTSRAATVGFRLGFTDGTDDAYTGVPIVGFVPANGASEKLYTNSGSAQEFGVQFTSPSNAILKVRGVVMAIKNISATGDLRYRLYTGSSPSLVATTLTIPHIVIATSSSNVYIAFFATAQTINPNTVVSVTAGNTAADSSSAYLSTVKSSIDTDANSLPLFPFGGLKSINYTAGAWQAPKNTEVVPFWLILDSSGEFGTQASGGAYVQ
jgi:hypothetical protein